MHRSNNPIFFAKNNDTKVNLLMVNCFLNMIGSELLAFYENAINDGDKEIGLVKNQNTILSESCFILLEISNSMML